MDKVYLFVLLLHFSISGLNSQLSIYEKKKLTETEINTIVSYYKQDGDHSAVTGGRGTEKLDVFSMTSELAYSFDSVRQVTFGLGFDYISSASTDKINFQRSSASEHDQRIYLGAGYSQVLPFTDWSVGVKYDMSAESDYLSNGLGIFASKLSPNRDWQLDINLQYFTDDLRWRKNFFKPTELIYPEELKDTSWFDIHHRKSINLSFSYRKDLNRRLSMAIFHGIVRQSGILSTPFHRVYFGEEEIPRVENLPRGRWKIPLGVQVNSFISPLLIARVSYQYYWDNYGIRAHMINAELPLKLSSYVTLIPSLRWYDQTASTYFKPYREHTLSSVYYTSDYDLSAFNSLKFSLEIKSLSNKRLFKRNWLFDQFSVRYAYYRRSDELDAHIISTLFDLKNNNYRL